jgi:hypothetical protein
MARNDGESLSTRDLASPDQAQREVLDHRGGSPEDPSAGANTRATEARVGAQEGTEAESRALSTDSAEVESGAQPPGFTEAGSEVSGGAGTAVDSALPLGDDQARRSKPASGLDTQVNDPRFDRPDVAEEPPKSSLAPTATQTPRSVAPADASTFSVPPQNGHNEPLLTAEQGVTFQTRWEAIQTRFVDEPRGAVEDADTLVANLMQQLAQGFAQERERLEAQWGRGEDISTEDLRVALQRYRSFFQRLLST